MGEGAMSYILVWNCHRTNLINKQNPMSKYYSRAFKSKSVRVKSTNKYVGPKYMMNILLKKVDCINNEICRY